MCLDIGIVTCGPNEALIISGLFQGREGSLVVGAEPSSSRVNRVLLIDRVLMFEHRYKII